MAERNSLKSLAFTIEEYQTRVEKVRLEVLKRGLDAILIHTFPSICYLTGFQTIGSAKYFSLLVPSQGDLTLLSQDFESYNAKVSSWLESIVTYPVGGDPILSTQKLLSNHSLANKKLGIELHSPGLKVFEYLRLKELLPSVQWVDISDLMAAVKSIKSPAEVEIIRQAAKLSSLGMRAAIEAVAEGVTDNVVAAAAYQTLIGHGSEYMCYDPIVTVGRRSGIPHTTHGRVKIEQGDAVFMEIGACMHRYSAPTMRTVFVGTPHEMPRRMAEACLGSITTVIQNATPGTRSSEVAAMAKKALNGLPSSIVWHGYYGYSIGIGFPPEWSDGPASISENDHGVLQAGMVFHCSTSLREVGQYGATFSETIVITNDGCEVLTDVPPELVFK
ncbi:MAG: Xaa-Pro peptidase family protein [Acidobacteria bacterium]|nr:Xaa-Pro peptidase family protein [Acidobacteriota bacterium]MCI0720938.1 Xaa-Pro peptidase family protein [Acidobacteriota bacterium]